MTTYYLLMRLCRWDDLIAQESNGLFPDGRVSVGPHGEQRYLPVFETREAAEAASDDGMYPITEVTTPRRNPQEARNV